MIQSIAKLLGRHVSDDAFDRRLGQGVCFVASGVLCLVSFWKLTQMDLTEAQFFFGMLLSLITPLLLIVIGLLLPMARPGRHS